MGEVALVGGGHSSKQQELLCALALALPEP